MRNKLIIIFFSSFFSFTFTASGQKLVNSPYSRFNIGSMEPAGSFRGLGMGGTSIAMRDNTSIYFSNPASYSSFDTLSFVFDFGLDVSWNKLKEGTQTYKSDDSNFDHLLMGFPISKGWGFALGVIPISTGYYRMADIVKNTDNPSVGGYSVFHSGDGSFSNFFMGTGLKLTKNLSAGVNMTVLFGSIKRTNQFEFFDFYNSYNNSTSENLELGGINFDYGLQYSLPLKNGFYLNAGASYTTGRYYNSNYEKTILAYTGYSFKDTIDHVAEKSKTAAYLPGTFRAGLSFGKKNKFTTGLDYITSKWSDSKIPGSTGYAADSRSLQFGAEYIPDKFSNYSYIRRIEYRIGGHTGDNYLIVNGEQVKEVGISCGLGIPMRQGLSRISYSKTNVFFDYTRRTGSEANNMHRENYFTVGVSLNLYDWWFIKRKYE